MGNKRISNNNNVLLYSNNLTPSNSDGGFSATAGATVRFTTSTTTSENNNWTYCAASSPKHSSIGRLIETFSQKELLFWKTLPKEIPQDSTWRSAEYVSALLLIAPHQDAACILLQHSIVPCEFVLSAVEVDVSLWDCIVSLNTDYCPSHTRTYTHTQETQCANTHSAHSASLYVQ